MAKEQTGTEEARSGLGVGEVKRRREEEKVKSGLVEVQRELLVVGSGEKRHRRTNEEEQEQEVAAEEERRAVSDGRLPWEGPEERKKKGQIEGGGEGTGG